MTSPFEREIFLQWLIVDDGPMACLHACHLRKSPAPTMKEDADQKKKKMWTSAVETGAAGRDPSPAMATSAVVAGRRAKAEAEDGTIVPPKAMTMLSRHRSPAAPMSSPVVKNRRGGMGRSTREAVTAAASGAADDRKAHGLVGATALPPTAPTTTTTTTRPTTLIASTGTTPSRSNNVRRLTALGRRHARRAAVGIAVSDEELDAMLSDHYKSLLLLSDDDVVVPANNKTMAEPNNKATVAAMETTNNNDESRNDHGGC
jgi:hypothetical protein